MSINNSKQNGKYQSGSGSNYHKEHAGHVPDYGGIAWIHQRKV